MTIKSLTAAVALFAASALPTLADQLSDVKERGTLKCGVLSIANPFGFQDPDTRELVGTT